MPWFPGMYTLPQVAMENNYSNLKRKGIIGRLIGKSSDSKPSNELVKDIKEDKEPFIPTIEMK